MEAIFGHIVFVFLLFFDKNWLAATVNNNSQSECKWGEESTCLKLVKDTQLKGRHYLDHVCHKTAIIVLQAHLLIHVMSRLAKVISQHLSGFKSWILTRPLQTFFFLIALKCTCWSALDH